jgi:integrase/recombinase XerD
VRFLELVRNDIGVVDARRAEIAGYVRDLRERPGPHGANVVALDSGAGLANATLWLRVTVVRLFYDFVVEEDRICSKPRTGGNECSSRSRSPTRNAPRTRAIRPPSGG